MVCTYIVQSGASKRSVATLVLFSCFSLRLFGNSTATIRGALMRAAIVCVLVHLCVSRIFYSNLHRPGRRHVAFLLHIHCLSLFVCATRNRKEPEERMYACCTIKDLHCLLDEIY